MTRRVARLAGVALVVAAAGGLRVSPRAQSVKLQAADVRAVEGWVSLVFAHEPGAIDGAAATIARLPADAVASLTRALPLFVELLRQASPELRAPKRTLVLDSNSQNVNVLAQGAAARMSAVALLTRAVMLHTDAAILRASTIDLPGVPTLPATAAGPGLVTPPPRPAGVGAGRAAAAPAGPTILFADGQMVGASAPEWNWTISRLLVAQLAEATEAVGARDPFVSRWYHASTAYLLGTRQYAETNRHFSASDKLMEDDSVANFDRGCAAELDGLPDAQAVRAAPVAVGGRFTLAGTGALTPQILPVSRANALAERYFRRVTGTGPVADEARIRRGRIADVNGAHGEALAMVGETLERLADRGNGDRRLEFYAHLIAARAARGAGGLDTAGDQVGQALRLFPNAQSALLLRSQLSLSVADVSGAMAPVARLSSLSKAERDTGDPWRDYELGAGRDASAIMADLIGHRPAGSHHAEPPHRRTP